jgi:hypothetical protein
MVIHVTNNVNENQTTGTSIDNIDKKRWRTPVVEKLDVKIHTQLFLPGPGNDGVEDFVS